MAQIQTSEVKNCEWDAGCRILITCIENYYKDPKNKADYEAWLAEKGEAGVIV